MQAFPKYFATHLRPANQSVIFPLTSADVLMMLNLYRQRSKFFHKDQHHGDVELKTRRTNDNINLTAGNCRGVFDWPSTVLPTFGLRPLPRSFLIGGNRKMGSDINSIFSPNDGSLKSRNWLAIAVMMMVVLNVALSLWLISQMPKGSDVASRSDITQISTKIESLKTDVVNVSNEVFRLQGGQMVATDEMRKRDDALVDLITRLHRYDGSVRARVKDELFKGTTVESAFGLPLKGVSTPRVKASLDGILDMSMEFDTDPVAVLAMRDGVVENLQQEGTDGSWTMTILHEGGFRSTYSKVAQCKTKVGKQVKRGSRIGFANPKQPVCLKVWLTRPDGRVAANPLPFLPPLQS